MHARRYQYCRSVVVLLLFLSLLLVFVGQAVPQEPEYVGSETCADCHPDEYDSYKEFSKKAHSGESVKVMAGDLNQQELEECYHCHTTGFGKPGGFVSFEETPEMGNAGCESCHGPGSIHIDDMDPNSIEGNLHVTSCERCHNPDRVANFDYKPLLFGGAH